MFDYLISYETNFVNNTEIPIQQHGGNFFFIFLSYHLIISLALFISLFSLNWPAYNFSDLSASVLTEKKNRYTKSIPSSFLSSCFYVGKVLFPTRLSVVLLILIPISWCAHEGMEKKTIFPKKTFFILFLVNLTAPHFIVCWLIQFLKWESKYSK